MEIKEILNVAVYQQNIIWENPDANFEKVERKVREYVSMLPSDGGEKPDVIVVPETFSTGFGDHMVRQAEEPEGGAFRFALKMARCYDALFVGTWTVLEDGVVYNRLHLVRPDGTYDYYDKAHTFRMSSEASQLGRGRSSSHL